MRPVLPMPVSGHHHAPPSLPSQLPSPRHPSLLISFCGRGSKTKVQLPRLIAAALLAYHPLLSPVRAIFCRVPVLPTSSHLMCLTCSVLISRSRSRSLSLLESSCSPPRYVPLRLPSAPPLLFSSLLPLLGCSPSASLPSVKSFSSCAIRSPPLVGPHFCLPSSLLLICPCSPVHSLRLPFPPFLLLSIIPSVIIS